MLIRAHFQEEIQLYLPASDWTGTRLEYRVSARTSGITYIRLGFRGGEQIAKRFASTSALGGVRMRRRDSQGE
jgi:hypothetical protein